MLGHRHEHAGVTEYIFSINTGRSGSKYLKVIFDHVRGCRAFHEPLPTGNGAAMRRFARGRAEAMQRIAHEKAKIIEGIKGDCRLYVETNHCFIKGFGWLISQHFPEESIGVIVLSRDAAKTSTSMLRIGCSPLRKKGKEWITTPDKKNPLVTPPTFISALGPRQSYLLAQFVMFMFRCVRYGVGKLFGRRLQSPQWLADYEVRCVDWYIKETAAQAEAFKGRFPGIRYYEVDVEALNTLEQVEKMLAYFGHEGDSSLSGVVGRPVNLKRHGSGYEPGPTAVE